MGRLGVEDQERLLGALRESVAPEVFEVWCRRLSFEGDAEAGVTIPVPNPYYKELLDRDLRAQLEAAFLKIFGRCPRIDFAVRGGEAPPVRLTPPAPRPAPVGARLNPALTFERFVIGPSNRFARAAAEAVAKAPGRLYNPLFIHGSVGLGKTHLLQAVAHEMLHRQPELKIFFLSCEGFVNEYIQAVQKNSLPAFRARYRTADALFLDDIHFLSGKEASQEEVFHTYNALHGSGKQIVLASDAPPHDIRKLQEQLVSRFKSGLVARVDSPDFETRAAVIDARARERGRELPEEVLHFLASAIQTNFRDLEGAVTKLIALGSVSPEPVGLEMARAVARDLATVRTTAPGVGDIQKIVCEYFKIQPADLGARRWTKTTSLPRQLAIYLVRRHTAHSLKEIGSHFGGKDHATISYAVKRVERLLAGQATIRAHLEALERRIAETL
jgi:chromosomal replication initiator protein